ncbi:RHS repeat-associated core domain-containing protein [Leptolyngbya sp. 7M]|uniref:RHS repeat-associated core domain-containing protein n=1 Tax=Leptolyngbya sp. 7M TaxID=2812896 RepID=UPI001CEC4B71|nr:RHS repeat-associated core domain-containing protein [Leptolyngbya sp. 7M]
MSRKGYAGYEHDPTFEGAGRNLYHVRHRVYDADVGRWTRRDPLGYVDGMSLYEYVMSNPLLYADPLGLERKGGKDDWKDIPPELKKDRRFGDYIETCWKPSQNFPPGGVMSRQQLLEAAEEYIREYPKRVSQRTRDQVLEKLRRIRGLPGTMMIGPLGLLLIVSEVEGAITDRGAPCRLLFDALKEASRSGDCSPSQLERLVYASLGTVISVPGGTIQGRVLGPGVNPFGSTNPDGVYVLNSTGDVTIRDARIHGTLVVRAPGRMVTLAGSVNLAPARADYPALIVEGNVTIDTSSSPLLEVGVLRNLNPPGAPYMGQTDALLDDAYPSEITGLVHVRGDVAVTGSLFISGGLLVDGPSGNLDLKGSIAVEWSPSMVNQPLMGYAASVRMVPVAGTWRRVLLP